MAKVEIITRCYNRLEYTVMCVRSINHKTEYKDYSHILIDQSSTDGTKEWIKSLEKEGFYKLKYKLNKKNSGDAGGMKDGYDLVDKDCKYIMQFDNDCMVDSDNYLENIVKIMDENPKIGILMLKRNGVGTKIPIKKIKKINDIRVGEVDKATCCMIIRKKLLDKINIWYTKEKIGWGFSISNKIKNMGYSVMKTPDITVTHIDAGPENRKTRLHQIYKYPLYRKNLKKSGSNYKEYKYKNEKN